MGQKSTLYWTNAKVGKVYVLCVLTGGFGSTDSTPTLWDLLMYANIHLGLFISKNMYLEDKFYRKLHHLLTKTHPIT